LSEASHHRIVIIGGGDAGIALAARLRRAGVGDIAIIEPSERHFYQPLWTLVGAGVVKPEVSVGRQADYIPSGVTWIRQRASEIDPESRGVTLASGDRVGYDFLAIAAGLQVNFDGIPGMREALERPEVSTNYSYEMAPKTWAMIRNFSGGVALFHMPGTPIKCPGAPQKIMYMAADNLRRRGLLSKTRVIYGSATPAIYSVKEFAAVLNQVVERYGIDTRFGHDLVEIRPQSREAIFAKKSAGERVTIQYDMLHVAPPQSAPDFIRQSPLVAQDNPGLGWVDVDQYTMVHRRYPNVFALGDVAGTPNAKTGAAAMKQAPVVAANLQSAMRGAELTARYNGYVACPIVTGYGRMLLCEFDYTLKPTPTITAIDTIRERYDMWLLKRYGLPWIYWNLILRGRNVPFHAARGFDGAGSAYRPVLE